MGAVKPAPKKPAGRRKVEQLWGGALDAKPTTLSFERSPSTPHFVYLAVRRQGLEAQIHLAEPDLERLWRQLGRIRAERLATIAAMDRATAADAAEEAVRSHAAAQEAAAEITTATSTSRPE